MAAKKTKTTMPPAVETSNSKADILFREQPFERLLLLSCLHAIDLSLDIDDPNFHVLTEHLLEPVTAASAALSAMDATFPSDSSPYHYGSASRQSIIDILTEAFPDRWTAQKTSDLLSWIRQGRFGHLYGNNSSASAPSLTSLSEAELKSDLARIVLSTHATGLTTSLRDDLIPAALQIGKAALCRHAGFSLQQLDDLETDPALCEAFCRLAFFGPKELSMVRTRYAHHLNFTQISHRWTALSSCIVDFSTNPIANPEDSGFVGFAEPQQVEKACSILSLAAAALRSSSSSSQFSARDALLALTSGGASGWGNIPLGGDVSFSAKPGSAPKRLPGMALRGESARLALAPLAKLLQWRSMSHMARSFEGAACGADALDALLEESSARTASAPIAIAAALSQLAERPDLHREISCAFATLVARGFSSLPAKPGIEDYLPGYLDAAEANPKKMPAGSLSQDPMGKISAEASRIFNIPNDLGAHAVVGEARKALLGSSGLSPAAWRSLASAPALAAEFEKMLKLSKPRSSFARGVAKKIEEVMALADSGDSDSYGRLRRRAAHEERMLPVEAAAKALSTSAMCGWGEPEQTRLLKLLQSSLTARAIAAGSLPNFDKVRAALYPPHGEERSLGEETLILQAARADAAAMSSASPSWIKGMSERLERAYSRFLQIDPSPAAALSAAIDGVSTMLDDVLDCARAQPLGFWTGLDAKDPFSSALRQHHVWTQALQEAKMAANPELRLSWPPLLARLSIGRCSFSEISSGMALFEEGKRMSHCVSSYVGRCAGGGSRIFSGMLAGVSPCTVELAPFGKKGERLDVLDFERVGDRLRAVEWRVVQNRAKHNGSVSDPEMLQACADLANQYSKAFSAQTQEMALSAQSKPLPLAAKTLGR